MSDSIPVTAVFDIGKTNKKFVLFDEKLEVVYERKESFEEIEDDDGDPCEDLPQLVKWIEGQFDKAAGMEEFDLHTLNFSTYGATLVHLDEDGEVVTPLYNYLKPYPQDLQHSFYSEYGGKEQFSVETASPPMGMLNSGLQLYWLKHRKPGRFQQIHRTLHFPQYLAYLFTGEFASEHTSIGCHTGMWNFGENDYHEWLDREEVLDLMPTLKPVNAVVGARRNGKPFNAGPGIHDSSAALVPYLNLFDTPFILVSTGTWSISLNPYNREPLTYDQLRRDCLCYLNVHGEQVKASRLFLGNEYDHQKRKLNSFFNRREDDPEIELDVRLISRLAKQDNDGRKLELEKTGNSGPYPQASPGEWNVEQFDSFKKGYHQLMLDLVSIQADSIRLAEGAEPVDTLVITGGFSRNDFFVRLLASRFPGKNVYTATQPNASALGAAMVAENVPDIEKDRLKELLDLKRHNPLSGTGIESYSWAAK